MAPAYKLVVHDINGEHPYGLTRWIKLEDKANPFYEPSRKQPIRKKATA